MFITPPGTLLMSGCIIINFLQRGMIMYPDFHPPSSLSAAVVLVLRSLILFIDLGVIVVDMLLPKHPKALKEPESLFILRASRKFSQPRRLLNLFEGE
jgi:hypothetical protein